MEQIVVKKEPKEVVDNFKGDILINYDERSTSADQEMPSTSWIAIKQEFKEELSANDNMDYNDFEGDILMKPSTSADPEMPSFSWIAIKQEIKEELWLKEETFTEKEALLNKGSKINESDHSDNKDEIKHFSCNIKEEGRDSDFPENDYTKSSHNEEKEEDEAMFETKLEVKYHGVEFLDKSGTGSKVNKEIMAKMVLPKAGKEIETDPESRSAIVEDVFYCVYKCKHCSVKFLKKELLESHGEQCLRPRVNVGKEKPFKCDLCPKKYETKRSLLHHKKYFHRKDELEKFKCDQCDYETVTKSSFKSHLKVHDNKINISGKTHQCTKCTYSTAFKINYDDHLKLCLKLKNVKWYDCQICHYRTIKKSSLNVHKKIHSKIKELKCLFCQYKCNQKQHLDNHILTHHSDLLNESNRNIITSKIHQCKHCNFGTTISSHLKRHLKNHH
ncbi:unnamed protein product [Brassicogethes aeneus]|uniref:C2H2-type domain-containing protein n=1 Tax=Brassicogethes aeneus TaxID=1431903 RepID=A0A9P0B543_BRAAE|nr:unnamed protein product [Brassicogethes aeneus]